MLVGSQVAEISSLKKHVVAMLGEFVGTFFFLFIGESLPFFLCPFVMTIKCCTMDYVA